MDLDWTTTEHCHSHAHCVACRAQEPMRGMMFPVECPHGVTAGAIPPRPPAGGPGTELKKLLRLAGLDSSPNCACNRRAQTMDLNGADWCAANIEMITDWLAEEATRRKLPFVRFVGKLLIRRAIRNALEPIS